MLGELTSALLCVYYADSTLHHCGRSLPGGAPFFVLDKGQGDRMRKTLRELRLERGMTQSDLAAAVGVTPKSVVYAERRYWRPR